MKPSDRPTFRADLHVEVVGGESLFALSEERSFRLHHEVYALLGELIDGRRTLAELVGQLEDRHSASEVTLAVERLQKLGLLVDRESVDATGSLTASPLSIRCMGQVDPGPVRDALLASGVRFDEAAPELTLVLVDDYLRDELDAFNRAALAAQAPWMLLKTRGKVPWVGPLFVPGGACFQCLAARLRKNRQVEGYLRARNPEGPPIVLSKEARPEAAGAALGFAVSAIVRWLAGRNDALRDRLVTVDLEGFRTQHHTVVKRPQCVTCGDSNLQARLQEQAVALESSPKVYTDDGGYRACPPSDTVRRLAHQVSPITGLVARLDLAGASGTVLPSFTSGHNLSRVSATSFHLEHHLSAVSRGAGKTEEQARASALCEALERACGVFRGDEARTRARFREFGGDAIHPNRCLHFSEEQYRNRIEWNTRHGNPTRWVPEPFDEDRRVDWSPVWSLTRRTRRYLPTALCYYDYPLEVTHRFVRANSNGSAAGNTFAEATLQGILEVVERDSVALWWYNELRVPEVALDSFDDDYFRRLARHYARIGRELWVLDITTDVDIPAFAAVSRNKSDEQRISVGFGAHIDARIGIQRALTEMNQFLPFVASEEASKRVGDADIEYWLATASVEGQQYLEPTKAEPARQARDYSRPTSIDLKEDVEACVAALEKRGLETLVLDQSRPDVELSVVKVVVPEMRHFWPRFGPGRLFDVPVRLGRLERARKERELNERHVFF